MALGKECLTENGVNPSVETSLGLHSRRPGPAIHYQHRISAIAVEHGTLFRPKTMRIVVDRAALRVVGLRAIQPAAEAPWRDNFRLADNTPTTIQVGNRP